MTTLLAPSECKLNVGMGQIHFGRAGQRLEAVLGSCVGVVLLHPRQRVAALAHVVLPCSNGRAGSPGKFADTAIPEMLRIMAVEGIGTAGLVAKIAGGANMFGNPSGPMQIGDANITAVNELLAKYNLRPIAKDLGGNKGRRISVDCQSGMVDVEVVGQLKAVL
jgi:chemotaxis protein CheD